MNGKGDFMKDRKAEACRQSADQVRVVAYTSCTILEREAFQRLADGYDVLAQQLERIAARRPKSRPDDLTSLGA